ncbi:MAG: hypothetical protein AAGF24_06415 [Cyanobacteria bacterium P01_H01_bin.121]
MIVLQPLVLRLLILRLLILRRVRCYGLLYTLDAALKMGRQSTAKTIFLLASMVGWLIVGAALIYLFPIMADVLVGSERTHLWLRTLSRGDYNPMLAYAGGGVALLLTTVANVVWYQWFEGKL